MKTDRRAFLGAVAALALVKVPREPDLFFRGAPVFADPGNYDELLDVRRFDARLARARRLVRAFERTWEHQLSLQRALYGTGIPRVPWKENR